MGLLSRGPIPDRSDNLQRPREHKGVEQSGPSLRKGTLRPVTVPHASKDWHSIARKTYDSLRRSGQSEWFQDSDWAIAWTLCDDLSRYKSAEDRFESRIAALDAWECRIVELADAGADKEEMAEHMARRPGSPGRGGGSAMKLAEIMRGFSLLMMTEADRRRVRVELESEYSAEVDAGIAAIEHYVESLRS